MPRLQPGGFTRQLRRLLRTTHTEIALKHGSCTKKDLAEWIGITPSVLYRFMRDESAGIASPTVDRITHFFGIEVPAQYVQQRPLRKRTRTKSRKAA